MSIELTQTCTSNTGAWNIVSDTDDQLHVAHFHSSTLLLCSSLVQAILACLSLTRAFLFLSRYRRKARRPDVESRQPRLELREYHDYQPILRRLSNSVRRSSSRADKSVGCARVFTVFRTSKRTWHASVYYRTFCCCAVVVIQLILSSTP